MENVNNDALKLLDNVSESFSSFQKFIANCPPEIFQQFFLKWMTSIQGHLKKRITCYSIAQQEILDDLFELSSGLLQRSVFFPVLSGINDEESSTSYKSKKRQQSKSAAKRAKKLDKNRPENHEASFFEAKPPKSDKVTVGKIVPDLIERLVSYLQDHNVAINSLKLIHTCLVCYPNFCGSSKNKLWSILSHYLGNDKKYIREATAICIGDGLFRCGGPGSQSTRFSEQWLCLYSQTMNTLREILKKIDSTSYEDEEIDRKIGGDERTSNNELPDEVTPSTKPTKVGKPPLSRYGLAPPSSVFQAKSRLSLHEKFIGINTSSSSSSFLSSSEESAANSFWFKGQTVVLPLPVVSQNKAYSETEAKRILCYQYSSLMTVACHLLRASGGFVAVVPVEETLIFLQCAFEMFSTTNILSCFSRVSRDHQHCNLLSSSVSLLSNLLKIHYHHLLPFASKISALLKLASEINRKFHQSNDTTNDVTANDVGECEISLTCEILNCSAQWIDIASGSTFVIQSMQWIINLALKNLKPFKEESNRTTLNEDSSSIKNKSSEKLQIHKGNRKRKRKSSNIKRTNSYEAYADLCSPDVTDTGVNRAGPCHHEKYSYEKMTLLTDLTMRYYQALSSILHSSGPYLKPGIFKAIYSTTLPLLDQIIQVFSSLAQSHGVEHHKQSSSITLSSPEIPIPCGKPACRIHLIQLIHDTVLNGHPSYRAPLTIIIDLLAKLERTDPSFEVRSFIKSILNSLRVHIHPEWQPITTTLDDICGVITMSDLNKASTDKDICSDKISSDDDDNDDNDEEYEPDRSYTKLMDLDVSDDDKKKCLPTNNFHGEIPSVMTNESLISGLSTKITDCVREFLFQSRSESNIQEAESFPLETEGISLSERTETPSQLEKQKNNSRSFLFKELLEEHVKNYDDKEMKQAECKPTKMVQTSNDLHGKDETPNRNIDKILSNDQEICEASDEMNVDITEKGILFETNTESNMNEPQRFDSPDDGSDESVSTDDDDIEEVIVLEGENTKEAVENECDIDEQDTGDDVIYVNKNDDGGNCGKSDADENIDKSDNDETSVIDDIDGNTSDSLNEEKILEDFNPIFVVDE